MTKEQLIAAGQAAFGQQWQTDLSRALGVSDRTVRRWVAGKYSIPPSLPDDIISILNNRKNEIESAMGNIMNDRINGQDVTTDIIEQIVNKYEYRDDQDRKNAIDEINNAIYPETHLSDLEQIAKNLSI